MNAFLTLVWIGSLILIAYFNRQTKKSVGEFRDDLSQVKTQVKNNHSTNLRNDIDAVRASAENAEVQAAAAKAAAHRIERGVADLGRSVAALEKSLDSRSDAQTRALDEEIREREEKFEEVNRALARSVVKHVKDCPLRTEKDIQ